MGFLRGPKLVKAIPNKHFGRDKKLSRFRVKNNLQILGN